MYKIDDFIEIYGTISEKDFSELERGGDLVVVSENKAYAGLNPKDIVQFIGYLEFPPNKTKGNQYHLEKTEYITIIKGVLKAEFELIDNSNEKREILLEAGMQVKIMPRVIHKFTAIGEKVVALEYSPNKFVNSDVYRIEK